MEMFREAWEVLKKSWKRLLKLYLIMMALIFGAALLLLIAVLVGAALTPAVPIIVLLPLVIFGIVMSFAMTGGSIMIVYDENVGAREAFKKGISKFLPLFGAGILMMFFVGGGMFVFVIPAIVFGLLLIFTNYEIVLNNAGVLMAMRRSVYLVKENAGEVIKRLGAFILFSIVSLGVIPGVLGMMPMGVFVAPVYSLLVNSVYSWFSVCYFVVLYKSLKEKTPGVTGKGLWVMGVVAILGWVIFILMFGAMAYSRNLGL